MIEVIILALIGGGLFSHFMKPKDKIQETSVVKQAQTMNDKRAKDFVEAGEKVIHIAKEKETKQENQDKQKSEEQQKIQDKQENQQISSQPSEQESEKGALSGKIICIDPGHQSEGNSDQEPIGPGSSETKAKVSSGTKGVATGKYEYVLNLEVALKLKTALIEKGATVYMVRETNAVDISNKERAELANEVKADLSLRIHADGSDNSSACGFSVLVPGGSFVSRDIVSESYTIGTYIEKSLQSHIDNPSRGIVTREDLSGFNWSKVPAVLVEMGFMSNPEEDVRMSTAAFQEALVKALVEALESYYSEEALK